MGLEGFIRVYKGFIRVSTICLGTLRLPLIKNNILFLRGVLKHLVGL